MRVNEPAFAEPNRANETVFPASCDMPERVITPLPPHEARRSSGQLPGVLGLMPPLSLQPAVFARAPLPRGQDAPRGEDSRGSFANSVCGQNGAPEAEQF